MIRAALLSAVLLCACAAPTAPPVQPAPAPMPAPRTELGREVAADMARLDAALRAPGVVEAGAGQTANLGDSLTVRPLSIIEDSRCPPHLACLWEGRLRILANVSGQETQLTLGESQQTPHGAVTFAVVSPGAWAEWPTDELGPKPGYRFGFRRG